MSIRTSFESPPVAKSALCLTTPVDDSGAALPPSSRRSNLDLNGRLVKRGSVVSFHGLRYLVSKTNRGFCYCKVMSISGRVHPFTLLVMYPCESVQVVGV
jgi:hypothetical protein